MRFFLAFLFVAVVAAWQRQPLPFLRIQRRLCSTASFVADEDGKARLEVTLTGPSVTTALFRAELKKELVFFRGCRAFFALSGGDGTAMVVAEGKTKQITRFVEWLEQLKVDQSERKANFQGPSLVAYVQSLQWMPAKGDLPAGFTSAEEPPALSTATAPSGGAEDEEGEGRMAGSDESV